MLVEGDQRRWNVAAIRFAVQYYVYERPIIAKFQQNLSAESRSVALMDWATHFAVARTFTGMGDLDKKQRKDVYVAFVRLLDARGDTEGNSASSSASVKRVSDLEQDMCATLSAALRDRTGTPQKSTQRVKRLQSAATKFLWLVDCSSIIYDANVRSSLKLSDDYAGYCTGWNSAYAQAEAQVVTAAENLRAVEHMFPADWTIAHDSQQHWFRRRIFDQLHWST